MSWTVVKKQRKKRRRRRRKQNGFASFNKLVISTTKATVLTASALSIMSMANQIGARS